MSCPDFLISQQDKHLLQDAVDLCRNILSKYDLKTVRPVQPELANRHAGLLQADTRFIELRHVIDELPTGRRI